ncbi:MAG: hypothetical protein M3458_07375 [Acidobacteriota bacterium]|nr:hypothetical protein [Acidobacteriota bacterium]
MSDKQINSFRFSGAWGTEGIAHNFSNRRIKSITHSEVESYKLKRLETLIVTEKKVNKPDGGVEIIKSERSRSITSVNRQLEQMRAIMRFAQREGWISRSPFETGSPLILAEPLEESWTPFFILLAPDARL